MDHFCYLCLVFVMLSCLHCNLVVTCWERADLLALMHVMFSFVDHFCYLCLVFAMLSCLFIATLWSPAGKELTSWLSCM